MSEEKEHQMAMKSKAKKPKKIKTAKKQATGELTDRELDKVQGGVARSGKPL